MEPSSSNLEDATSIVKEMATLIDPVHHSQPGTREGLLALSHRLTASLEMPSETIQRIGWAEVQHLPDSKEQRLPPEKIID